MLESTLLATFVMVADAGEAIATLVYVAIVVLSIVGGWKVFTKAGQPGWAIFIPIFNLYVLLCIAGRPWWWLLLFLIPIVNVVLWVILLLDVAASFGQSALFGIGLFFLFPIFFMILGLGSAQYAGPAAR
ncbi:MAG: DUF5684 domain-containing protein [Planctomycetota bacterium]|jgi:hypothetical protein